MRPDLRSPNRPIGRGPLEPCSQRTAGSHIGPSPRDETLRPAWVPVLRFRAEQNTARRDDHGRSLSGPIPPWHGPRHPGPARPPAPAPQKPEPTGLGVPSRSAGKAHHADDLQLTWDVCHLATVGSFARSRFPGATIGLRGQGFGLNIYYGDGRNSDFRDITSNGVLYFCGSCLNGSDFRGGRPAVDFRYVNNIGDWRVHPPGL